MAEKKLDNEEVVEEALYEALCFIKNDLDLSDADLALILKISETDIESWLVRKEFPARQNIIHFVYIHKCLCNMFSEKNIRVQWLNAEHPILRNSPINILKKELQGLDFLKSYIDNAIDRGA